MRHPHARSSVSWLAYDDRTPVRWRRTASAVLDESVGLLCLRRWGALHPSGAKRERLLRRG